MLAGAAVMLVVLAVGGHRLPRELAPWAHLTVMAMVANIAPYFFFGWGIERVASGLAGVLNATTPLFTLAFALTTRSERLSAVRVAGLLLGFVGVVLLAAPWRTTALGGSLPGVGACLLGSACYAASYIYARRFLIGRGFSALALSTGQMAAGALLLVLATPVVVRGPITLTPTVISSVLVLGVLGTGVAYVLNYRLIADEGAVAASTVTYLIPVVAVVLGALILNEPLTWHLLAGGVVVLVGVAVSEGRLRKTVREEPLRHQAELERRNL
jgi:drug/metabolite transporter (DMT)-like permease